MGKGSSGVGQEAASPSFWPFQVFPVLPVQQQDWSSAGSQTLLELSWPFLSLELCDTYRVMRGVQGKRFSGNTDATHKNVPTTKRFPYAEARMNTTELGDWREPIWDLRVLADLSVPAAHRADLCRANL